MMRRLKIFYAIWAFVFIAVSTMVLNPNLRDRARFFFVPPHRSVLALVPVMFDGVNIFQVLKVRTENGLFLEVYDTQHLITKAKLLDKQDGYFTFAGSVTNLAVDDIDGDKTPEIIAPTYDDELSPRLNIYKYNPAEKSLEAIAIK